MTVPDRFKVGITRYQPGDAEDLAAFQREAFGPEARQLDPGRFAWLFERNPSRGDDGPGLWVCRRNDVVVGQQAEIPFEVMVAGTPQAAAWGIDLMVDPAWRMRGVGPGLVATQLEAHDVVVGLTQAEEAFKSYIRGGWTDVGVVPVYVRPLELSRFIRAAPLPPRARRFLPLARLGGPVFRGTDALLASRLRLLGVRLVEVDRFDDRVDEVWAAAAGDYPVIATRDAASTRWRLDDRPDADELRRYYLVRRGRTIGYVALRQAEQWGDTAAFVIDYLAPRRWAASLLMLASRAARHEGAFALFCRTLCEPIDRSLRFVGFARRGVDVSAPLHLVLHSRADEKLTERLSVSRNWFLTAADSDMS